MINTNLTHTDINLHPNIVVYKQINYDKKKQLI